MTADRKEYLGDGVYVEVERGMVKLTTSNGFTDTNTIFLEPEVYQNLTNWFARVTKKVEPPIVKEQN